MTTPDTPPPKSETPQYKLSRGIIFRNGKMMNDEQKRALIDESERARQLEREHVRMKGCLRLILRGLKQGSISSQPIIIQEPEAEEWPMKSLNEIIEEALP